MGRLGHGHVDVDALFRESIGDVPPRAPSLPRSRPLREQCWHFLEVPRPPVEAKGDGAVDMINMTSGGSSSTASPSAEVSGRRSRSAAGFGGGGFWNWGSAASHEDVGRGAMLDAQADVQLIPRADSDLDDQCRSPLRCVPLKRELQVDDDAVHRILHAIVDYVGYIPGVRTVAHAVHTAFLGNWLPIFIPFLLPPLPPFALCKAPNTCKLMPAPFMSLRIFGKPLAPFGYCFNTDAGGIKFKDGNKGFDVKDPRTIVWEDSPSCKEGVRIHFIDGEASTGMTNRPEENDDLEAKHTYHAMTFVTISPANRRRMREAMVHRRCTASPWSKIFTASPTQMLRNFGGPNFLMPFFLWMPLDEFDFMSFTVAQREAGGDCEVDE